MRDETAAAPSGSPKSLTRAWIVVGVFLIYFVVSHIDRAIINMMVEPVKRDLSLSDFQMSLLLGPAFGLFYVLCGVPMGWLVDRFPRGLVTFCGVTVWGVATALCGFAGNYLQLFFARMGVGVGESTLTPSAHALITDTFPQRHVTAAMSVYALGAIFGGGLATAIGGVVIQVTSGSPSYVLPLLGEMRSWQVVFVVVGLLTLLMLPLCLLLRENADTRATVRRSAERNPGQGLGALIREHPMLFVGMPTAFGLIAILANAYGAWVPTFMMRVYGWSPAQVGIAWGAQHIVAGVLGQATAVGIVNRMQAKGRSDACVIYPLLGLFVSAPTAILGFNAGSGWGFLLLSGVFYVFTYSFFGYASAGIQRFTPPHLRGRVSAMFMAVLTVVGVGLGAPLTGWLTDNVFRDEARLGASLSLVTAVVSPLIVLNLYLVARKIRSMTAAAAGGPTQAASLAIVQSGVTE
jgi:MFS family permease